jgi:hypothetical protein
MHRNTRTAVPRNCWTASAGTHGRHHRITQPTASSIPCLTGCVHCMTLVRGGRWRSWRGSPKDNVLLEISSDQRADGVDDEKCGHAIDRNWEIHCPRRIPLECDFGVPARHKNVFQTQGVLLGYTVSDVLRTPKVLGMRCDAHAGRMPSGSRGRVIDARLAFRWPLQQIAPAAASASRTSSSPAA